MTAARLATYPILAGLNGWCRFGTWSAHLYVDGEQQCHTAHGMFDGGTRAPKRPDVVTELTVHGTPFGRVCSRCLKIFRRQQSQPSSESVKGNMP